MSWLQRRGHLLRFSVALLVSVIVAACDSGAGASAPPAVEKQQIKLGVLPIVGAAPAFLAKEQGYFANAGLDVQFVTIQSSETAIPALVSGELDLVFGNYVSFFAAQSKNTASIKFVADGYFAKPGTWVVMVAKGSKLRGTADIAGKRLAVTASNGLPGLTIKSVLDTTGVGLASPTYVEMPYTEMGAALQNNRVDAALLAEPYVTDIAKRTGALPLFDAAAGPTADIPISGYAATAGFATKNPNTITAFQRALSEGATLAGGDRTKVEQIVHKYAGVDEQTAALMAPVGYPTRMDPTRLQRIPDLMSGFGLIPNRIEAKSMILPSAMTDR